MKKHSHQISRSCKGESIIALLIGTVIMTIAATAAMAMFAINTRAFSGFWNKGHVLSTATDAINRIGLLTRSARSLGDVFGVIQVNNTPTWDLTILTSAAGAARIPGINKNLTTNNMINGQSFLISPTFPSAGDPYYGTGALPASVYGGVWPWAAQPQFGAPSGPGVPAAPGKYTLAQDTLIVQVPVFVNFPAAGMAVMGQDPSQGGPSPPAKPYIWPATWNGLAAGGTNGSMEAVDTYVFRVVPDPPGQTVTWALQEAVFPACPNGGVNPLGGTYNGHPTNITLSQRVPQTVLRGIVGPCDANGKISTFSYVERVDNQATNTPPAAAYLLCNYIGVMINFEVLSTSEGVKASVASFKTEVFLRNNTQVELMGPPPPG